MEKFDAKGWCRKDDRSKEFQAYFVRRKRS
jgi:hypothetical protein